MDENDAGDYDTLASPAERHDFVLVESLCWDVLNLKDHDDKNDNEDDNHPDDNNMSLLEKSAPLAPPSAGQCST